MPAEQAHTTSGVGFGQGGVAGHFDLGKMVTEMQKSNDTKSTTHIAFDNG